MRRPWNIVDSPVYSLATYDGGIVNMNICTYVSAVSRKPKLYAIAIEKGSKTQELMLRREDSVLQLMTSEQIHLVRKLGKQSGYSFDKQDYLVKNDWLEQWHQFAVLRSCAAYLLLKKMDSMDAGDHDLFLCELVRHTTKTENGILMFQQLVEQKIIL